MSMDSWINRMNKLDNKILGRRNYVYKEPNRQASDQTRPLTGEILEPRQTGRQTMSELERRNSGEVAPARQAPDWASYRREAAQAHHADMTVEVGESLTIKSLEAIDRIERKTQVRDGDDSLVAEQKRLIKNTFVRGCALNINNYMDRP